MAAATAEEESALPRRSFPDEIEAEILLWLPVKTVIRFKCACKSWYSLISSPQFQKDHFRRGQTKPPLLLTLNYDQRETDRDYYLTLRFSAFDNKKEKSLTLVNSFSVTLPEPCYKPYMFSCLGLVCLFQKYGSHPILVCNPSTHKLITLPPTDGSNISIGFDVSPVYPYPRYGFWTYPTDNVVDESILLNCSTQEGVKLLQYDPKDEIVMLKDKEWAAAFYT